MKTHHAVIKIQTEEKHQFIDLTEEIKKAVQDSKIQNGIINIVSRHTTTAILLNENEPLLLKDFTKVIQKLFPPEAKRFFQHDDIDSRRKLCPGLPKDECQNAKAHCHSIVLTNSQTLNIVNGKLDIGHWQNILFLELDQPKEREISMMIMGE